jgi:cell division protein FtsZ
LVQAETGLRAPSHEVDILITLANQHALQGPGELPSLRETFSLRNEVWCQAVHSLIEVMTPLGLGHLKMAQVRPLMARRYQKAFLGTSTARGAARSVEAAWKALSSPLSGGALRQRARGLLVTVAGGSDQTLYEVHQAACHIAGIADEEAQALFSFVFVEHLQGELCVTVLATGV